MARRWMNRHQPTSLRFISVFSSDSRPFTSYVVIQTRTHLGTYDDDDDGGGGDGENGIKMDREKTSCYLSFLLLILDERRENDGHNCRNMGLKADKQHLLTRGEGIRPKNNTTGCCSWRLSIARCSRRLISRP